jgi:two-component system, OmpR family, response regulator
MGAATSTRQEGEENGANVSRAAAWRNCPPPLLSDIECRACMAKHANSYRRRQQADEPLATRGPQGHWYGVDTVATSIDFQSAAKDVPYDLFIVDLMLPDGDGLDAIRSLRMGGCASPILVMTARGKIDDRVTGLDAGADDYLIKPFNHQELFARVRALLRRPQKIVGPLLRVGNLEFNDATGEVRCSGNLVHLRPAERRLLTLLMRRRGSIVTKPLIEDAFSEAERDVSPNSIEATISRLRKALEEIVSGVVIETHRGVGYKLSLLHTGLSSSSGVVD